MSSNWLLEYKKAIDNKECIVGVELKVVINQLIDDIKNKKYVYDTKEAEKRIDFMEKCVRTTKSPFYNKPLKLLLWQKAFIEALYSFKMPDGTDRFKKALLLIARKNGKSELSSGISFSEFIRGNAGSEIVCSSNDDMQASIVYDSIDTMRALVDPEDKITKRNQTCIRCKFNNNKIYKLSDKTRNKEGRNIDFAIIDETHEMKDDIIYKAIEMSQSVKDNPKFIEITTEGYVLDGHLDNRLRYARKVINGEDNSIAAERQLFWLYTQDSEEEVWKGNKENRLWEKSNPSLGVIKKFQYLEEQVDLARGSKSDRLIVLSKDFNIKQSSSQRWLDLQDYDYGATYNLEDFRDAICLGAVDLSQTTDLTCAKVMLLKKGSPVKYIHTQYFIPETKLEDGKNDSSAGAKYKEWSEKGYVTICEGSDISLEVVADWFYSLYTRYNIRLYKCGYDQKFSKEWITAMEQYGWTKKTTKQDGDLIMILQNSDTLSNALKYCEADFKNKLINYNDNPVDKWCLSNAGLKIATNDTCLCVKVEPCKRIDGAVTLIILYEMYRRYRIELKNYLEG